MRIAEGVHEIADAQAADLRDHVGEQRVAGDVERHTEEDVAAALVELAAELAVRDVELEHRVAGHQRHVGQIGDVPGADDQPPRIRVALDLVDDPADLVDLAAVGGRPASPLFAVDRAEFAVFVGPLVPDPDLVLFQIGDVGLALEEPQQLMDDRAQVQLLGGDQRETRVQIEAQLPAEHAARAGAGAIRFLRAVFQHMPQQIQIRPHQATCGCSVGALRDRNSSTRPSATSGRLNTWPMVSQSKAR